MSQSLSVQLADDTNRFLHVLYKRLSSKYLDHVSRVVCE